jgi:hypothetical protein
MGTVRIVKQQEQDVELTDGAKLARDPPQRAADLARDVGIELQHRQELAKTPRRDARPVNGPDVARLDAV